MEMKCNSSAKDDFEAMLLISGQCIHKRVGSVATWVLPFWSTYLIRDIDFSTLVNMKTRPWNNLWLRSWSEMWIICFKAWDWTFDF